MNVQALFVDPDGIYPKLLGADRCWPQLRDARTYGGLDPVVAHPPCARWCRMAVSIYVRTGKDEHRPGNDDGCFASALKSVRSFGGVLEHPAETKAWDAHRLRKPEPSHRGWTPMRLGFVTEWVCEVWQSAYGHAARKRTWLFYRGRRAPFELQWGRPAGSAIVSQSSRRVPSGLPRLSAKENSATPLAFGKELIRLARWSMSGDVQ